MTDSSTELLERSTESDKPIKNVHTDNTVVLQLPIWPEPSRGIPNTIARSALFNVRFKKTLRRQLKNHIVTAIKGTNILYTGEELRQDDETVFLQLLHYARLKPWGEYITFKPSDFLKNIGWPVSGQNHYKRLIECMDRLNANGLKIQSSKPKINYNGSLIRKFVYFDEEKEKNLREWIVWIEPEVIKLFDSEDYSQLHWEQRLKLKKPVAQWLHSFYTSYEEPMEVKSIMKMSEAATKKLSVFRATLKKSLDDLVKVGFIKGYEIDANDKVHVKKA
ncbi:MAG: plasmid replication initiator TrfA [Gammaproteobacteria bacterium]|nr:plasmid replication initiator TrfA [Gammaproteobacteria bacterium]